jgi:hypothetical protein
MLEGEFLKLRVLPKAMPWPFTAVLVGGVVFWLVWLGGGSAASPRRSLETHERVRVIAFVGAERRSRTTNANEAGVFIWTSAGHLGSTDATRVSSTGRLGRLGTGRRLSCPYSSVGRGSDPKAALGATAESTWQVLGRASANSRKTSRAVRSSTRPAQPPSRGRPPFTPPFSSSVLAAGFKTECHGRAARNGELTCAHDEAHQPRTRASRRGRP